MIRDLMLSCQYVQINCNEKIVRVYSYPVIHFVFFAYYESVRVCQSYQHVPICEGFSFDGFDDHKLKNSELCVCGGDVFSVSDHLIPV